MNTDEKLLLQNKAWATEKLEQNADYFKEMALGQHPKFLWIGCSDARVPANEITNSEAGEMFVHRNIANMVVHTDFNLMSVLQYSVEVLKIPHVIVAGHYGCGGVIASMDHVNHGLINKWLRNIKEVYRLHSAELNAIPDTRKRADRLVELNVEEQVLNLAKTSIVQSAWHRGQFLRIHGWVYGLDDGRLHELIAMDENSKIDPLFKINFEQEE